MTVGDSNARQQLQTAASAAFLGVFETLPAAPAAFLGVFETLPAASKLAPREAHPAPYEL